MAFDGSNWARASAHNNTAVPHIWCYATTDSESTMQGTNYFLSKYQDISVNDVLLTSSSDGISFYKFATVSSTSVVIALLDAD